MDFDEIPKEATYDLSAFDNCITLLPDIRGIMAP